MFTFFGLVATVGTTYVAIEHVPWVAWPAACGVGFLACALLVVNNLRDIPTDTASGKRTLAVRIGDRATRVLYVSLVPARSCWRSSARSTDRGRCWRCWQSSVAVAPVRRVLLAVPSAAT